jgi:hypothetical protein
VSGPFAADPAQFLDVDVHQLPGALSLIAVGWLWWLQATSLAQADPRASHLETVESAMLRTSAISAAVIRSRRSASIA